MTTWFRWVRLSALAMVNVVLVLWALAVPDVPVTPPASLPPIDVEGLEATAAADAPNVLVVVIDTLRVDYLGFMGHHREAAPFLASMAERSAVFDRAFSSSSWTAPATASLFTGLYPHHHGVVAGFMWHVGHHDDATDASSTFRINRFRDDAQTLPRRFREAGYVTIGAATNVNIGDAIGFSDHFDRFWYLDGEPAESVAGIVSEVAPHLKAAGPSLVYLHLNDVHIPYERHDRHYDFDWRGSWLHARFNPVRVRRLGDQKARYLSEVSYLDGVLERIVERLDFGPNDIIVVTSDHGEEFLDHGQTGHGQLYDELNRILLMVHAPDRIAPSRLDANVSLIDVLPTVLDLAGLPRVQTDGLSLVPLLQGSEAVAEQVAARSLLAHREVPDGDLWAVRSGDLKLLVSDSGVTALYNLGRDPGERRNLVSKWRRDVKRLSAELEGPRMALAERRAENETSEVPMTEELRQQLEALGYVEP